MWHKSCDGEPEAQMEVNSVLDSDVLYGCTYADPYRDVHDDTAKYAIQWIWQSPTRFQLI